MSYKKSKLKGIVLLQVLAVIIILLIGIAIFLPLIVKSIEKRETLKTEEKLEIIKEAIVGKEELMGSNLRTSYGFVGDLGILPATLNELMVQGSYPSWTIDATTKVEFGWRGPYLNTIQHNGNYVAFLDTWGNLIQYENGTGAVLKVLRSYGPDGQSGTTDDITLNIEEDEVRGYVKGTIKNGAGVPRMIDQIDIYYPNGTSTLQKLTVYPDFGDYSTETDTCSPPCPVKIPIGKRKIITDIDNQPPQNLDYYLGPGQRVGQYAKLPPIPQIPPGAWACDFYLPVNGGPYMNWNLRCGVPGVPGYLIYIEKSRKHQKFHCPEKGDGKNMWDKVIITIQNVFNFTVKLKAFSFYSNSPNPLYLEYAFFGKKKGFPTDFVGWDYMVVNGGVRAAEKQRINIYAIDAPNYTPYTVEIEPCEDIEFSFLGFNYSQTGPEYCIDVRCIVFTIAFSDGSTIEIPVDPGDCK
ncbi:MAG: hypothetical protein AB1410_09850 [Acidobacteriota bacterium]